MLSDDDLYYMLYPNAKYVRDKITDELTAEELAILDTLAMQTYSLRKDLESL